METEQLKMILDALQSLGAEGKEAFIWWLVLDKTVGPLVWLITLCGLIVIARWIIQTVATFSRMDELREELLVSQYHGIDRGYSEAIKKALEFIREKKRG
jgi:hypothetical protein